MYNIEQSISVSQLNEYVKMLIDSDELLQTVVVCGEISNFKNHYATGHLYFSLKDEKSLVKCVMFAGSAARLRFEPENGMQVTVWGRVSVFPRDGAYQLYVGFMSPSGLGDQLAAFEILKNKLLKEGLFDSAHKLPIPRYPQRVGIVTSPTGAAVRDIMNVLYRRWPIVETELYPALVQGSGAVSSLIDGISYFNKTLNVDVIILGRGGGSGEDLSAFNDELLARTIFESHIPIISGVGHETDTSICDYVADLRAPTPSAAAELAVPDINEYLARLNSTIKRANGAMNKQIEHYDLKLRSLSSSPVLKRPMHYLEERQNELAFFEKRIESAFIMKLKDAESAYLRQVDRLKDLNPMAVLSRGFSMVRKDESVVTSASDLKSGDRVALTFSDGTVNAVVE
jgi:exodeoxyribonuclease VII large subunit